MSSRLIIGLVVLLLAGVAAWVVNDSLSDESDLIENTDETSFDDERSRDDARRFDGGRDRGASGAATSFPNEEDIEGPYLVGRVVGPDGRGLAACHIHTQVIGGQGERNRVGDLVDSVETESGEDGRFILSGLTANAGVVVILRHEQHAGESRTLRVDEGRNDLGDIELSEGAIISGMVRDESGAPLAGVLVSVASLSNEKNMGAGFLRSLLTRDESTLPKSRSGRDGRYRVTGIKAGKLRITARSEEHPVAARDDIAVTLGEERNDIDFVLGASLTMTGIVVDDRGEAVVGAEVSFFEQNPSTQGLASFMPTNAGPARVAVSDEEGRFTALGLDPTARLRFDVSVRDHFELRRQVVAENLQDLRIVVERGPKIALRLTTADGAAFGGPVEIRARRANFGVSGVPQLQVLRGVEAGSAVGMEAAPERLVLTDLRQRVVAFDVVAEGMAILQHQERDLVSGEVREVEVILLPGRTLSGQVRNDLGDVAAHAIVKLSKGGAKDDSGLLGMLNRRMGDGTMGVMTARTKADEEGRFVFTGVPDGPHSLIADKRYHQESPALSFDVDGDRDGIELSLVRFGSVGGTAYDAQGAPLANAAITIQEESSSAPTNKFGAKRLQGRSDAKGQYVINSVPAGAWLASVKVGGNDGAFGMVFRNVDEGKDGIRVEVLPGEEALADLRLKPKASLLVEVYGDGVAAPDLRVRLRRVPVPGKAANLSSRKSARTDTEGQARFEQVDEGEYSARVSIPGSSESVEQKVKVTELRQYNLRIDLPGGGLVGTVVDASTGLPVAGANVSLRTSIKGTREKIADLRELLRSGGISERSVDEAERINSLLDRSIASVSPIKTSADGRFAFRYLKPGARTLQVACAGYSKLNGMEFDIGSGVQDAGRVELSQGAVLEVSASQAQGGTNPALPFANVTVKDSNQKVVLRRMIGLGRPIRIDTLANGTYDVEVSMGEEKRSQSVTLEGGKTTSLDLKF